MNKQCILYFWSNCQLVRGKNWTVSCILQKLLLATRFSASGLPLVSSFAAIGGARHREEGEVKCVPTLWHVGGWLVSWGVTMQLHQFFSLISAFVWQFSAMIVNCWMCWLWEMACKIQNLYALKMCSVICTCSISCIFLCFSKDL